MTPEQQIETVAKIIFGEAWTEGEDIASSEESLMAVANTMRNRSLAEGTNVFTEATAPSQYSIYLKPKDKKHPDWAYWDIIPTIAKREPEKWAIAMAAANQAINGNIKDNTDGATYYYNPEVVHPDWADKMTPIKTILSHIFLKDPVATNKYSDEKLQKAISTIKPVTTQEPQEDIIPEQETIPVQQPSPKVIVGNETPEEASQKEFAMKVSEHSKKSNASPRFKKALDAWVGTMTDKQKKIVQDYLPEHFEQENQPSPGMGDWVQERFPLPGQTNMESKENLRAQAVQSYPFKPEMTEQILNQPIQYPGKSEVERLGVEDSGGYYEHNYQKLTEILDSLSPAIYKNSPTWLKKMIDSVKGGEQVNVRYDDPEILTHEVLHSIWNTKMLPSDNEGANAFIDRFNQKWEEAKKEDHSMESIDHLLTSNKLYEGIRTNKEQLASERFAYLTKNIGKNDASAVPPQLRAYYTQIFLTKPPMQQAESYKKYLVQQEEKDKNQEEGLANRLVRTALKYSATAGAIPQKNIIPTKTAQQWTNYKEQLNPFSQSNIGKTNPFEQKNPEQQLVPFSGF